MSIHVLLIEDNPGDTRLIQEMLRDVPEPRFRLATAGLLRAGLTLLDEDDFDVVLLDLSLPDSFGVDTLRAVRDAHPQTAIVVLTGFDGHDLGVRAMQAGAQDYLVKGDTDGTLLARALRYALERHRIDEALRRSEAEYRSLINDVFDTSMVAVLILNRDFEVVWCNEATEVYFGVQREELLGQDKRSLIDSRLKCIFADPDDYATRLLDAYNAHSFTDRFECHVTPEGDRQERWLEHWSQPIRSGIFTGGRIEQYTDITDRKLLELREQQQRHFAEALIDTAALLTSTLRVDEVLDRVLTNVERVVPHDSANIMLRQGGAVYVVRQTVEQPRGDEPALHLHDVPALVHMVQEYRPAMLYDLSTLAEAASWRHIIQGQETMRSYAGAPIILQDQVIGFINLFSRQPGFFTVQDTERLMAFAGQAAIGIQNAQLYEQSQELATIKERQRLARELHDSVSQTLFTSKAMAESALRQWDINPSRVRELLRDVYQLSTAALAEMRVLLLELRPAAMDRVSLRDLLGQLLEPIQARRNLAVTLDIDAHLSLPSDVQMAFYRIVQEALNNIEKHAEARMVEIGVIDQPDRLELSIRDDGQGFDPNDVGMMSLGIGIMHERAEEIGATCAIESVIGVGTHILVTWMKS